MQLHTDIYFPLRREGRMLPLHLYARVRVLLCAIARETAGAARTRSSLRPLFSRGSKRRCKTRAISVARSRSYIQPVIACDKREAFGRGANATEAIHLSRVFSAQKLAAAAGLSERYVNELLYEAGASCTTRLLELRLRKAADLLAHSGERRISDIAFGCGFNDLSYFNRCFRRRFGQTPTAARGVACSAGRRFVIRIRTKPAKRYFDATCASHPRYHVMTMSNDDIITPPRRAGAARSARPARAARGP